MNDSTELLTVRLRYKEPHGKESKEFEASHTDAGTPWGDASENFRFAASVAAFGMILRNSTHCTSPLEQVADWASASRSQDEFGWRAEFVDLVKTAKRRRSAH